ncbi:hypothetical protein GRAN_4623 [Granulicella sibirica]|uniref:Uncharacterized protein n=1 Tax=Granulicella sibirica TaxID=2479048 RepID=A0A4Q0SUE0_9BACT|nr:hypothetical protein GRAN_4623 [Granulicella sibirica]
MKESIKSRASRALSTPLRLSVPEHQPNALGDAIEEPTQ